MYLEKNGKKERFHQIFRLNLQIMTNLKGKLVILEFHINAPNS